MISVIVPVYNTEKYLKKCIDSIRNQTHADLQIIIIDDGSTDHSGEIADEIAGEDARIFVKHTENGGQAAARNMALDIAEGEFVAFVDSDDALPLDACAEMLRVMEQYDADLVAGGVYGVDEAGNILYQNGGSTKGCDVLDRTQVINEYCMNGRLRFEAWNKLYKREMIGDERFPERKVYEEIDFFRRVLKKCNSAVYFDCPVYYYLDSRPGNTQSTFTRSKLKCFDDLDAFISDLQDYPFAKNGLIKFRMDFLMSRIFEAKKSGADRNILDHLDRQFIISKRLLRENNCRVPVVCRLYAIHPSLAEAWREFYSWFRN